MQILLVVVGSVIAYVLYKLKQHNDKYKHISGITMLDFFKNHSNLAKQTAQYTNEKFAKIDTPAFTLVLATHPDSAKVSKDFQNAIFLINFFSLCSQTQRTFQRNCRKSLQIPTNYSQIILWYLTTSNGGQLNSDRANF